MRRLVSRSRLPGLIMWRKVELTEIAQPSSSGTSMSVGGGTPVHTP
jgi:hypothetical protein